MTALGISSLLGSKPDLYTFCALSLGAAAGAALGWYSRAWARKYAGCAGCAGECKRCAAILKYAAAVHGEIQKTAEMVAKNRNTTVEALRAEARGGKAAPEPAAPEPGAPEPQTSMQRGRMNWIYGADNVAAQ
jgi:hypothetical protein